MELWYFCVSEDEEGPPQRRGRGQKRVSLFISQCVCVGILHCAGSCTSPSPQSHEGDGLPGQDGLKTTGRRHVGESGASAVIDIAAGEGSLYAS